MHLNVFKCIYMCLYIVVEQEKGKRANKFLFCADVIFTNQCPSSPPPGIYESGPHAHST